MSSRGAPSAFSTAVRSRCSTTARGPSAAFSATSAARSCSLRMQARRGGLAHAVGVEDEQVAGLQRGRDLGQLGALDDAERRADVADRRRACRPRGRGSGAGARRWRARAGRLSAVSSTRGERGGDEARRLLAQQRVVEADELVARAQAGDGVRAQRVAGERRDRGRLRALAADVADDERVAPVALREDVVEVAADLVALARGAVGRGQLQAVDLRQMRREQRALERLGRARALLVEARVLDRDRRLGRDPHDHVLVLGAEHAGLGVAEEQAADDVAVARHDRARRGSCGRADGPPACRGRARCGRSAGPRARRRGGRCPRR